MKLFNDIRLLVIGSQREKTYRTSVDGTGMFDNRLDDAYPQTIVSDLVRAHFAQKDGKRKKALVIGYDAARADAMLNLVQSNTEQRTGALNGDSLYSAVCRLKRRGGLYLTFAGGIKGDEKTKQATSTAQGWSSILTGVWADRHGVHDMETLSPDTPTYLLELARQGVSGVYAGVWKPMMDTVFREEVRAAREEKLPLTFLPEADEETTHRQLLDAVEGDVDCIFGVYDAPDANGHGFMWGNKEYRYIKGVCDSDRRAYQLIEAAERRPDFTREDWLILVTSDHGGHKTWHGRQCMQDRTTFLASSKPVGGVKSGK